MHFRTWVISICVSVISSMTGFSVCAETGAEANFQRMLNESPKEMASATYRSSAYMFGTIAAPGESGFLGKPKSEWVLLSGKWQDEKRSEVSELAAKTLQPMFQFVLAHRFVET